MAMFSGWTRSVLAISSLVAGTSLISSPSLISGPPLISVSALFPFTALIAPSAHSGQESLVELVIFRPVVSGCGA